MFLICLVNYLHCCECCVSCSEAQTEATGSTEPSARGAPAVIQTVLLFLFTRTPQHREKLVISVLQPQSALRSGSLFFACLCLRSFSYNSLFCRRCRRVCSARGGFAELCPLQSAASRVWRESWNLGTTFPSHFVTLASAWRNSSDFG